MELKNILQYFNLENNTHSFNQTNVQRFSTGDITWSTSILTDKNFRNTESSFLTSKNAIGQH